MCHASAGCLPLPSQAAFAPLHFQLYRLQRSLLCQVAGAEGESVVLPQWGPDGSLYFVSGPPSRHHAPCISPCCAAQPAPRTVRCPLLRCPAGTTPGSLFLSACAVSHRPAGCRRRCRAFL